MKKLSGVLWMVLAAVLFGCGGGSGGSGGNGVVTGIKDAAVYHADGREAADVSGKLIIRNNIGRAIAEIGNVENGKLNISFPADFENVELAKRGFDKFDLGLPGVTVTPADTAFFEIKGGYGFQIIDKTAEVINFETFGAINTSSKNLLELRDKAGAMKVRFFYVDKDVTIIGKGSAFEGFYEFDIDVNAKKGWNRMFVQEGEASIVMKTVEKNPTDIKWYIK